MRTALKVVGGVVVVAVVLVIAAAVILPLVIDPNEHKPRIEAAVKEATGRDLVIAGDIGLSVFPWLGLELGAVELGNAPGFEPAAFARTERAVVRLKLLPLLGRRLELDTVVLHGLALNLARNADGTTNWADLAREQKPGEPPPAAGEEPAGFELAGLAVGGLDIRDGAIRWRDAQAGQSVELSDLRVATGAFTPGAPLDVEVAFEVALQAGGEGPPLTGRFQLTGRVEAEPEAERYTLSRLDVQATLAGEGLPGGELEAQLTGAGQVDLAAGVARASELQLAVGELTATGALEVEELLTAPRYQGRVQIARFDPKALLESLGLEPVETADPQALRALALAASVAGTPSTVSLEPLEVTLDQSRLSGSVKAVDLAKPAVRFDLALDTLDADRYLPPPAPGEEPKPAASPGAAGGAAAELPVETLQGLDVGGTARVGRLKVTGLTLTDVELGLDAKAGRIRLHPVAAKLYEGTYAGDIVLDARGAVPELSVDEKLAGVQAGPLLTDLQGAEQRLTGRADVTAALTAAGAGPEAMKRTANGRIRFDFRDGAVKGFNVNQMLRAAKAKLTGRPVPEDAGPNQTDFSELGGTVEVADGVATNQDLSAKSPFLRVEGAGEANLVEETVDYRLKVVLVAESAGQSGLDIEELAGIPVPVRIRGTFAEPSYGLDLEALASAFARSKAAEAVSAKQEEITEQVKEKAAAAVQEKLGEDAAKKLGGEKVEGAIKGLLGR